MKAGVSAVRANAQQEQIRQESARIISNFASMPTCRRRASNKVTKRILINGPYLLNGGMWDVKAKSLGAGIYELSLVRYKESE